MVTLNVNCVVAIKNTGHSVHFNVQIEYLKYDLKPLGPYKA